MFEGWDEFYLLIGGSAGALIGLLFVVATLSRGLDRDASLRGASLYMTPIVYHFGVVLTASAAALIPHVAAWVASVAIGLAALGGAAHALRIVVVLLRPTRTALPATPHWSDVWLYGVAPGVLYLGLAGAAVGLAGACVWSVDAVAVCLVALLAIGIRNAWDLVTWLSADSHTREA
jgi:hypothetical protein